MLSTVPRLPLPRFASTLFAGAQAVALATPAMAGGDIVKCVGADGRVTLTDGDCPSGVASVIVPAALNTAPGEDKAGALASTPAVNTTAVLRRASLSVQPIEHDNFIDPRPRGKVFARDAATLRAARASLLALDEAAASARSQRMASN